jgi:hypothetical protein
MAEWTGAWFVPEVSSSQGAAVVSGFVPSISARLPLLFGLERKQSTGLYYPEQLPLSMQSSTEIRVVRDGRVVSRKPRFDHTGISDGEFSIVVRENLDSGFTEVIAKNREGLGPPVAEIALVDSLIYILCRVCRPRLVVRFFDEDALVFIKACNLGARTGLPDPLRGSQSQATFHWEIFKAFLRQYIGHSDVLSVPIARRIDEVISSSNGSVHGFIVSLVTGIEKLFVDLALPPFPELNEDFDKLRKHVASWTGNQTVKNRAAALLGMLNKPAPNAILKDLQQLGVVTANEASSWNSLRPKVTHGELVDVSDEDVWIHRGRLITMFHRLVLRTIRYRGPITDFSGTTLRSVDFDWRDH